MEVSFQIGSSANGLVTNTPFHPDLHQNNFLVYGLDESLTNHDALRKRYKFRAVPVERIDGKEIGPHAPPYGVHPIYSAEMSAATITNPLVKISDYGTSFRPGVDETRPLLTPAIYRPPEAYFDEPATLASDIWTMAISLYEILGCRQLLDVYFPDPDQIFSDIVSALGMPPSRWWDKWEARDRYFEPDGTWISRSSYTPVGLHERMWDMDRGKPGDGQWDFESGELKDLEVMLRGMLAYEPTERLTADQLMKSDYMTKWAIPAWERQQERSRESLKVAASDATKDAAQSNDLATESATDPAVEEDHSREAFTTICINPGGRGPQYIKIVSNEPAKVSSAAGSVPDSASSPHSGANSITDASPKSRQMLSPNLPSRMKNEIAEIPVDGQKSSEQDMKETAREVAKSMMEPSGRGDAGASRRGNRGGGY